MGWRGNGKFAEKKEKAISLFREGDLAGARRASAECCAQDSEDVDVWLLLGLCQRGMGAREEAIESFRHAASLDLATGDANAALGRTYMDLFQFPAAVAAFEEGLRKEPGNEDCHQGLGEALLLNAQFPQAVAALRGALEHFPDSPHLHAQLADALEHSHQLEAAREEAERALSLHPANGRAGMVRARIDRRQGNLETARDRLQQLVATVGTPQERAAVAAELGNVLDRLGEYGEAFAAFTAGNEAMKSTLDLATVDVDGFSRLIQQRKVEFDANTTQGWAEEEPADSLPSPTFLVGFPRSGTTLTEQILASHPIVVASDEQPVLMALRQELPRLLGRSIDTAWDLCDLSAQELNAARNGYWGLVEEMVGPVTAKQRLLDKLPLNLVDLGLVYRFFPAAKVVVVVRDPRDACLSCFMQAFHLNQAMANFLDLGTTTKLYGEVMGLWFHYRSFIGNPTLEVRYEDLVVDLEGNARRLLEFLELPWDDAVLHFHEHAAERDVKTPSYSGIASPIYQQSVGRWRHYQEQLQPVMAVLQPFVEAFGYDAERS